MNTLSRYGAGRDVAGLQDEVERMFRSLFGDAAQPSTAGAWSPALDVEESDDRFTLYVELPGMDPNEVDITLEENVLTISGERRFYDESSADGFRRVERRFGRFHRAVRLPDRVNGEKVEANYRNGLLTITVPKADEAKPRRIEVHSA